PRWRFGLSSHRRSRQTRMQRSKLAVTACLPSGRNAACETGLSWSSRLCNSLPVATSHTRAVLSYAPDTSRLPSPEKATAWQPSPLPPLALDGARARGAALRLPPHPPQPVAARQVVHLDQRAAADRGDRLAVGRHGHEARPARVRAGHLADLLARGDLDQAHA